MCSKQTFKHCWLRSVVRHLVYDHKHKTKGKFYDLKVFTTVSFKLSKILLSDKTLHTKFIGKHSLLLRLKFYPLIKNLILACSIKHKMFNEYTAFAVVVTLSVSTINLFHRDNMRLSLRVSFVTKPWLSTGVAAKSFLCLLELLPLYSFRMFL